MDAMYGLYYNCGGICSDNSSGQTFNRSGAIMEYIKCIKCEEKFEPYFKQQTTCDNCAQGFGCAVCGAKFKQGTYHNCMKNEKSDISDIEEFDLMLHGKREGKQ